MGPGVVAGATFHVPPTCAAQLGESITLTCSPTPIRKCVVTQLQAQASRASVPSPTTHTQITSSCIAKRKLSISFPQADPRYCHDVYLRCLVSAIVLLLPD